MKVTKKFVQSCDYTSMIEDRFVMNIKKHIRSQVEHIEPDSLMFPTPKRTLVNKSSIDFDKIVRVDRLFYHKNTFGFYQQAKNLQYVDYRNFSLKQSNKMAIDTQIKKKYTKPLQLGVKSKDKEFVMILIGVIGYGDSGPDTNHAMCAFKLRDIMYCFNPHGAESVNTDEIWRDLGREYRCNKLFINSGMNFQTMDSQGVCVGLSTNFGCAMYIDIILRDFPNKAMAREDLYDLYVAYLLMHHDGMYGGKFKLHQTRAVYKNLHQRIQDVRSDRLPRRLHMHSSMNYKGVTRRILNKTDKTMCVLDKANEINFSKDGIHLTSGRKLSKIKYNEAKPMNINT